ncbi:hypothetical protein AB0I54_21865 [Streptomyces sp. NPDC050625]|uniref:hypothetical protein n=1 Tax=Streptomyces sp. NPDC050625 TaxID=3154629 RepID=UPI00344A5BED
MSKRATSASPCSRCFMVGKASDRERLVIAGCDEDLPIIYGQKAVRGWDFINWWCK